MLYLEIVATALSSVIYSVAYLYFLGLRIMRSSLEDKASYILAGLIVSTGILTATITLEGLVLIKLAHAISGRLLYMATSLGVFAVAIATAGVAGLPKPISTVLAHKRLVVWGLLLGNSVVFLVNRLSFSGSIPSLL